MDEPPPPPLEEDELGGTLCSRYLAQPPVGPGLQEVEEAARGAAPGPSPGPSPGPKHGPPPGAPPSPPPGEGRWAGAVPSGAADSARWAGAVPSAKIYKAAGSPGSVAEQLPPPPPRRFAVARAPGKGSVALGLLARMPASASAGSAWGAPSTSMGSGLGGGGGGGGGGALAWFKRVVKGGKEERSEPAVWELCFETVDEEMDEGSVGFSFAEEIVLATLRDAFLAVSPGSGAAALEALGEGTLAPPTALYVRRGGAYFGEELRAGTALCAVNDVDLLALTEPAAAMAVLRQATLRDRWSVTLCSDSVILAQALALGPGAHPSAGNPSSASSFSFPADKGSGAGLLVGLGTPASSSGAIVHVGNASSKLARLLALFLECHAAGRWGEVLLDSVDVERRLGGAGLRALFSALLTLTDARAASGLPLALDLVLCGKSLAHLALAAHLLCMATAEAQRRHAAEPLVALETHDRWLVASQLEDARAAAEAAEHALADLLGDRCRDPEQFLAVLALCRRLRDDCADGETPLHLCLVLAPHLMDPADPKLVLALANAAEDYEFSPLPQPSDHRAQPLLQPQLPLPPHHQQSQQRTARGVQMHLRRSGSLDGIVGAAAPLSSPRGADQARPPLPLPPPPPPPPRDGHQVPPPLPPRPAATSTAIDATAMRSSAGSLASYGSDAAPSTVVVAGELRAWAALGWVADELVLCAAAAAAMLKEGENVVPAAGGAAAQDGARVTLRSGRALALSAESLHQCAAALQSMPASARDGYRYAALDELLASAAATARARAGSGAAEAARIDAGAEDAAAARAVALGALLAMLGDGIAKACPLLPSFLYEDVVLASQVRRADPVMSNYCLKRLLTSSGPRPRVDALRRLARAIAVLGGVRPAAVATLEDEAGPAPPQPSKSRPRQHPASRGGGVTAVVGSLLLRFMGTVFAHPRAASLVKVDAGPLLRAMLAMVEYEYYMFSDGEAREAEGAPRGRHALIRHAVLGAEDDEGQSWSGKSFSELHAEFSV
jgi:hypothetical protein